VVAIFAFASAGRVHLRCGGHALCGLIEFGEGCGDGWARAEPCVPQGKFAAGIGRHAVVDGAVDHGGGSRVGPAERVAAEPGRIAQAGRQPILQNPGMRSGFRFHCVGERAGGAAEPDQFAKTPVHCFILRVAHILGDAGGGAGFGGLGEQRRVWPAFFDVFENDGGVEDACGAVDQHGYFGARVGNGQRAFGLAGAEVGGELGFEGDALFAQGDFDFLGVGGERVFVEEHGMGPGLLTVRLFTKTAPMPQRRAYLQP
jgi:hypothetical protein